MGDTDSKPEPRPIFVTSIAECAILWLAAWTVFGTLMFGTAPFTNSVLSVLPYWLAHVLASFAMAIPIVGFSLIPFLLFQSHGSAATESRFPIIWRTGGQPPFVGAAVWLAGQAIVVGLLWLLSFLET